ncbi:Radial spoke head protein 9 homolog [Durusdinium trenchii]|uniref:Radial spoke head protein 9 homolog n=1 Tax=Durusdinium trenchii TaxID=1381693 RepID=A0ABP0MIP9_9DINO
MADRPANSDLRSTTDGARLHFGDLEQGLRAVSSGGNVLSCEELCGLKAGLMLLKANQSQAIHFWGKILGKEADYYIACAVTGSKEMYPMKCFFYAGEDFNFTPLPELTEEVGEAVAALQLTTPLTGKPSSMLETVEGAEGQAKLTELQRLALLVQEIDFDTAAVPKGAHSLTEAQEVVPNSAFRGLEAAKATSLANYVHFRPPASVVSLKAQASNDLEFQQNFLETLETDLPKGCWALRQDPATASVTLRSLLWPGYSAFHLPGTGKFGGVYFGYATKNNDLAFLI